MRLVDIWTEIASNGAATENTKRVVSDLILLSDSLEKRTPIFKKYEMADGSKAIYALNRSLDARTLNFECTAEQLRSLLYASAGCILWFAGLRDYPSSEQLLKPYHGERIIQAYVSGAITYEQKSFRNNIYTVSVPVEVLTKVSQRTALYGALLTAHASSAKGITVNEQPVYAADAEQHLGDFSVMHCRTEQEQAVISFVPVGDASAQVLDADGNLLAESTSYLETTVPLNTGMQYIDIVLDNGYTGYTYRVYINRQGGVT